MLNKSIILLAVILFVALSVTAKATVFQEISYQGILIDSDTIRVNGPTRLIFKIYYSASGGSSCWDKDTTINVQDGVVNVVLGPITVCDVTQQWWLGITVWGESEMSPRIKLTAVPYSMNADHLDGNDASAFYLKTEADDHTQNNIDASKLGGNAATSFYTKTEADDYNQNNIDAKKLGGQLSSYYDPVNHDHDDLYYGKAESDNRFVNEGDSIIIKKPSPNPLIDLENTGSGEAIKAKAGIAGSFWGCIGVDAYVTPDYVGGYAVMGTALNTTGGGVYGSSKGRNGIFGITEASNYAGVRGEVKNMSVSGAAGVSGGNDNAEGIGVAGWSSAGKGVQGWSSSGKGVYAWCDGAGWALWVEGRAHCSMEGGVT